MIEYFTPKFLTDHLETIPAWKTTKRGGDDLGSKGSTLWLVLPWHSVWRITRFPAVVKEFVTNPDSIIMLHGIISEPDVKKCLVKRIAECLACHLTIEFEQGFRVMYSAPTIHACVSWLRAQ